MTEDIQRDLGRVEGEMNAVKDLLNEVRSDVKEIKAGFDRVRGGTHVLLSISAVLGGIISQIANYFLTHTK